MSKEIGKYHIVYFPMEQKYSIWLKDKPKLVKEWFNTLEEAIEWIKENDNQDEFINKKIDCQLNNLYKEDEDY